MGKKNKLANTSKKVYTCLALMHPRIHLKRKKATALTSAGFMDLHSGSHIAKQDSFQVELRAHIHWQLLRPC
jgi:hypothetical protein